MKKLILLALCSIIAGPAIMTASAKEPSTKDLVEETRKKMKTDKLAKKEVKRLTNERWLAFEGTAPLEIQQSKQIAYSNTTDENGEALFFMGNGSFTTNDKGAALKFAKKRAYLDIAEQLETKIGAAGNMELDASGAGDTNVSTNKNSESAKSLVAQKLSGVRPVVQMYRKSGSQYEVNVVVFYSRERAKEAAAEAYGKAYQGNPELLERARKALEEL